MAQDNNKASRQQVALILRLVGEDKTINDIAKETGLEYNRVYRVVQQSSRRVEAMERRKARNRSAFQQVMSRFFDIISVLGNPGALDYSKVTGGCGAQYAQRDPFALIDFTVDVRTTVKNLDKLHRDYFQRTLETQDIDPDVKSDAYLEYEQVLGSLFIERGLFPVAEYFGNTREGE